MKKTLKLGSYIITTEPNYLKIAHENKTWNFRIAASQEDAAKFFEDNKEEDWRKYFELAFASVQTFTILAVQSPVYMEQWIKWHNNYYDSMPKEVNSTEDAAIVQEEKILYDMREEASNEINKTEEP